MIRRSWKYENFYYFWQLWLNHRNSKIIMNFSYISQISWEKYRKTKLWLFLSWNILCSLWWYVLKMNEFNFYSIRQTLYFQFICWSGNFANFLLCRNMLKLIQQGQWYFCSSYTWKEANNYLLKNYFFHQFGILIWKW